MLPLLVNIQCGLLAAVFVPNAPVGDKALEKVLSRYALLPLRQRVAGRLAGRHFFVTLLLASITSVLAAQSGRLENGLGAPGFSTIAVALFCWLASYAAVLILELLFPSVRFSGRLAEYAKSAETRSSNPARWWLFNMLRSVQTATPTAPGRVELIDRLVDGRSADLESADRDALVAALNRKPEEHREGYLDAESLRESFGKASHGRFALHVCLLLLSFLACLVLVELRWPEVSLF